MITTAKEYNQNLFLIHNENPPILAQLPAAEKIYKIDISTRTIEAPSFLGVERDNQSETIYFEIDRFVDYMDLTSTSCVITYFNAEGKYKIYIVPFYDIFSNRTENKIIFPWCLNSDVFTAEGKVQFSIRFFKVGIDVETEQKQIIYDLNLLPAESKVLKGLVIPDEVLDNTQEKIEQSAQWFEQLQEQINLLSQYQTLKWTILN